MTDDEKSQTFRKRRLSLPMHHITAAAASTVLPDGDEKAQTFRKRRLSLTLHNNSRSVDEPPTRRPRRASETSAGSAADSLRNFPSNTLHADELLSHHEAPPSPAVHSDNVLYRHRPLPAPPGPLSALASTSLAPRWRRRHTIKEESKLPFPRHVVGTFSCHGMEPVYDSEYEEEDEEEEEEDEGWDEESPAAEEGTTTDEAVSDPAPAETPADTAALLKTVAKINQDRGGVAFPYGNSRKTALFAVYDGHGQGGELVSQFCLHEIQRRLEKHPKFSTDLALAFRETFVSVDEALKIEPIIEPLYAGTTACVVLLQDQKLTIANAGDSRAVLARKSKGTSKWQAIALTEDQNPDLPGEMERIVEMGGYVTASPQPGLSARVWLDKDCTQIGLAMARSLGDHAVADVGVIADPVVTEYELDAEDEFMILASDGVWEFLDSADAVAIVGANLDRGATKACQALIEAAAAKWHEEEGEYRDDITAIVVRLQNLWKDNAVTKNGKS